MFHMTRRSGIALAELFSITDQIQSALPPAVQDLVARFAVVVYRATRSPGAIIHHGKLQPLDDSFASDIEEFDVGIGTLSIPLIHSGLPFQLSISRAAITGNLEPASDAWQLSIPLADFALTLPQLEPAIYVPEPGTVPRHLLRDQSNQKVRIIGAAVLRQQRRAGVNDVDIVFVAQPDPLDPTLPSGAVASLTLSPPPFFIGTSEFGHSVGQLLFDFSESYSPPQVLELNQGRSWVGLAIREATLYAPRNLPVLGLGDLSGGVSIQVRMRFEEDEVIGWGTLRPAAPHSASGEADLQIQLLEWAENYPGADFLVIGTPSGSRTACSL